MLSDIVIDTNVLAHADNPNESRQGAAIALIEELLPASTVIAVDPGASLVEAENKSAIWAEYIDKIRPANALAYYFLQHVGASDRLREFSSSVDVAVARKINQMIAKASDRVFVKVAINTTEKVLVSHDYQDFSDDKRSVFRKKMSVTICDAAALTAS